MKRKLLFGDDSSSTADSAWLWVSSHRWPGWVIEVLTVGKGMAPRPRELLSGNHADGLEHVRMAGNPGELIRERGSDCDLIVIGSKGRGWRKALHLGSTAEDLMHSPPSPVMIIRGGHRAQRIMLAVDGSDHARAVEDSVAQLPWIDTVDIAVIGITETGKHAQAVWETEKRLAAVAHTTTAHVLGPDELQVFYRPSDTILEAAKKWNADIVALGSRGLSNWETLGEVGLRRAGSCAIAVAQSARCSVMLGPATS